MRRLLALRSPSEQRVCSPEWTILVRRCYALKWTGGRQALSTCPVSRLTSFTPQLFRVISAPSVALSSSSDRAWLPVWPST